jgi:hypothetical protein
MVVVMDVSQLTSVIEDQLSGNAHVVLVASVSRSERDITETKATLTSISALKPISMTTHFLPPSRHLL